MAISILRLDDAVQDIILLSNNYSQLSAKDAAKLYLAGLALLYHLKNDTQKIHKIIQEHGQQERMPPAQEIPAMSAVVQNALLFRALLSCLQVGAEQAEISSDLTTLGRKRTLSIGDHGPNKAVKLSNSPVPTMGGRVKLSSGESNGQNYPKPALSTPALAATILYGALRPIDHWPSPLVKVYCDDCFGGRKWVDAPECAPLVRNLALLHSAPDYDSDAEFSSILSNDADQVVVAYRGFFDVDGKGGSGATLAPGATRFRKGSVSSTDSTSADHVGVQNTADSDSSSGEEEDDENLRKSAILNVVEPPLKRVVSCYPVQQQTPNLESVRKRFFGSNRSAAHKLLVESLSDRLASKAKQSSGLLVALPSFLLIPRVRQLTADNLERWLQSPALAGLSRNLFYSVVKNMKNADPPLSADLAAVESIVAMQLKANQLTVFIENLVAIAKGVPNKTVVTRMYSKLISRMVERAEPADLGSFDELKMIVAIHRAAPPLMAYESLAAAMLNRLAQEACLPVESSTVSGRRHRQTQLVRRLCAVIRTLGQELALSFDGCALLGAFYAYDVDDFAWCSSDEEDRGRLMFQCLTATARFGSMRQDAYLKAKEVLLTWCCRKYGPRCKDSGHVQYVGRVPGQEGTETVPSPDYRCIFTSSDMAVNAAAWLSTMRCVLFMEDPSSSLMKQFINPGNDDDDDNQLDWVAIRACRDMCRPVDDEMLWIVLHSSVSAGGHLSVNAAIQLLECLFENSSKNDPGSLQVTDPTIVWELYNLTTYRSSSHRGMSPQKLADAELPQVASTSLWWRVTVLALIMCAASTERIGAVIWNESPTIRCLIKMVTSNRFRFPTVDCDEDARIKTKAGEQQSRDQESAVAEKLFLPRVKKSEPSNEKLLGSRASTRLRKRSSEARLTQEMAERKQRKTLLRAVQKAIMLWDPIGPARKPPKEAAELILAVERAFKMSVAFQSSQCPDFLLMTLGGTSRGSIERACDWLLPIISKIPTAISRLPSSASCFLLLRAYGSDGQTELKLLSAPLLNHVKSCLKGAFGSTEAVRALHLLMQDMASAEPEKRRCARRVLQASLTVSEDEVSNRSASWLLAVLSLEHVTLVLQESIQLMASAAALERGKNLLALASALEHFVSFASEKGIEPGVRLPDLAIELICTRPGVIAEAMDSHAELRSWFLRMISDEFERGVRRGLPDGISDEQQRVVRMTPSSSNAIVSVPLRVLEGASILMGIWKDVYSSAKETDRMLAHRLTEGLLLHPSQVVDDDVTGLSRAIIISAAEPKLSIDMWVMLAKARSDTIARLAALSAPLPFLPRLLLSTGLPSASLIVMIDRLGRLGDDSTEKANSYLKLLESLTGNQGTTETRRRLILKLHVRLAAYTRLRSPLPSLDGEIRPSTTFLHWLSDHCSGLLALNKSTSMMSKETPCRRLNGVTSNKGTSVLAEVDVACNASEATIQPLAWGGVDCPFTPQTSPNLSSAGEACSSAAPADNLQENTFTNRLAALAEVTELLELSFQSDEHESSSVIKWTPLLFLPTGTPEIWAKLFTLTGLRHVDEVLNALTKKCAIYWDNALIRSCFVWLAAHTAGEASLCLDRMMCFFAASRPSEKWYPAPQSFSFKPEYNPLPGDEVPGLSSLFMRFSSQADAEEECHWQVLAFLVGCHGEAVLDLIASRLSELSNSQVLLSNLLRVYLCCPSWIDSKANETMTRRFLSRALEICPDSAKWYCPISESVVNNGLYVLAGTGNAHSCRGLIDAATNHPLIVVGRIPSMVQVLRQDATHNFHNRKLDGRVQAEGIQQCETFLDNRSVLVKPRHWGYAYTEGIWLSFLDVLMGLPKSDLLFYFDSHDIGLLDLLSIYLLLLSVQNGLHPPGRAIRVKTKLAELLHFLKSNSLAAWKTWLDDSIEGKEIRHILMGLDIISPQEAINSLTTIV